MKRLDFGDLDINALILPRPGRLGMRRRRSRARAVINLFAVPALIASLLWLAGVRPW